jgi:hypothetical protein
MSTFTIYKAGVLSFCIAIVLLFACKKEKPDIMQPIDPCACASEVSADFDIIELERMIQFNPIGTLTDTIIRNANVIFRAHEENAEYKWTIGSENVTTQEVIRKFTDAWVGLNIPITLVVNKTPNSTCFPDDDGYDSVVKIMHVSNRPIMDYPDTVYYTSLAGTYRVKGPHLVDSFEVTFWASPRLGSGVGYMFNVLNFDGHGSNCVGSAVLSKANYRQAWSGGGGFACKYFLGDIHNRLDGIVEMNFAYEIDTPMVATNRTYYGRKIN